MIITVYDWVIQKEFWQPKMIYRKIVNLELELDLVVHI